MEERTGNSGVSQADTLDNVRRRLDTVAGFYSALESCAEPVSTLLSLYGS